MPLRPEPDPPTSSSPRPSLESALALVLCFVVGLGSLALVETDRRLTSLFASLLPEPTEWTAVRRGARVRTAPEQVVLVTIEGLRADAFDRAPSLSTLAEDAFRFTTVGAQASHPLVSLRSLGSGKYPSTLMLEERKADLLLVSSLDDPRAFLEETFDGVDETLVSTLGRHGYRTTSVSDADWMRTRSFGRTTPKPTADLAAGVELARAAFASAPRGVTWLHTNHLTDAADRASYDERLATLDDVLGTWLKELRASERWETTLLVLAGTSGHTLGERDHRGAGELYLEELLVPVLIDLPDAWKLEPRLVREPTELVDLLPTVLVLCGLDVPDDLDGRSLLPTLQRGVRGKGHLVAQTSWSDAGASAARRSVIEPGHWQVIHDAADDRVEFFHLREDPEGRTPTDQAPEGAPAFVKNLLTRTAPETDAQRNPGEPGELSGPPLR